MIKPSIDNNSSYLGKLRLRQRSFTKANHSLAGKGWAVDPPTPAYQFGCLWKWQNTKSRMGAHGLFIFDYSASNTKLEGTILSYALSPRVFSKF